MSLVLTGKYLGANATKRNAWIMKVFDGRDIHNVFCRTLPDGLILDGDITIDVMVFSGQDGKPPLYGIRNPAAPYPKQR